VKGQLCFVLCPKFEVELLEAQAEMKGAEIDFKMLKVLVDVVSKTNKLWSRLKLLSMKLKLK
jgi:hypothetical protein